VSIDRYLRTRPEISEDMPTETSGYFLSLDVQLPMYEATARITETILPPADSTAGARLVLDIDVHRACNPDELTTTGDFDGAFSKLRDAKNLVFEACITEETRGLFE
jgi:uncharacterized protein (TIGR04255 family)